MSLDTVCIAFFVAVLPLAAILLIWAIRADRRDREAYAAGRKRHV